MSRAPVILAPGMPDFYHDAKVERKGHGVITIDGQDVATTLQCPHCSGHFVSRRGSGARRGYCMTCNQVTCGSLACGPCVPFEKRIEEEDRKARR